MFALSDGRGRFIRATGAGRGAGRAIAAQFVDYDNDGLLDLLTWSSDGPHVFRQPRSALERCVGARRVARSQAADLPRLIRRERSRSPTWTATATPIS